MMSQLFKLRDSPCTSLQHVYINDITRSKILSVSEYTDLNFQWPMGETVLGKWYSQVKKFTLYDLEENKDRHLLCSSSFFAMSFQ